MTTRSRDGVLPVDKPEGPTSHDVVATARRALGERRVGHTGTLDPFASGLLLLCVGRATRLAEFLTDLDKCYEAKARLGVATDSEDREGRVVSETDAWKNVSREAVDAALENLTGDIQQVPPRFSAKKVGGEAAHRRVRRGEEVRLEPRQVTVHELAVTAFDPPEVDFSIRCSSGTYVRSVARDLGEALGVGAHLTDLRRTAIGPFRVGDALSLAELESPVRVASAWVEPLDALAHLPRLELDGSSAGELAHGRAVPAGGLPEGGPAVAAYGSRLVAVGEVRDASFRPRKVFA